jgi:phage N-6-adenine-methyltransferase
MPRPRIYQTNAERQAAYRRRKNRSVHFRSQSDEWPTPIELFNQLNARYHFQTDVCATTENSKCERFYTKEQDGLKQAWTDTCWMNPPYGREIGLWVRKAHESARDNNATVVCLLPARTDTRWWHDYCADAEVRFLKGRLKFGGATNSAPFPSAVVVFHPPSGAQIAHSPDMRNQAAL